MKPLIRRYCLVFFAPVSFSIASVLFCFESVFGQANATGPVHRSALWETWVVPGSISAIVALASLLYAIRKDTIAKKEKEKSELAQTRAETAEARVDTLTKALFRAESVSWDIHVEDLDGTLRTTCAWEDIEIIPKDVTLSSHDGALDFDPPDCRITEYPTCKKSSIEGAAKGREVKLVISEPKAPRSFHYLVHISGSLPYGSKLSYEYEFRALKGIFMSKEELEQNARGFKHEFWGHYVATPVERVKISIWFPEPYPLEAFYTVYKGKNFLQDNEVEKAVNEIDKNGGFKKGNRWAELTVDKPYYGCSYLIYWNPPPKKLIDALKQNSVG